MKTLEFNFTKPQVLSEGLARDILEHYHDLTAYRIGKLSHGKGTGAYTDMVMTLSLKDSPIAEFIPDVAEPQPGENPKLYDKDVTQQHLHMYLGYCETLSLLYHIATGIDIVDGYIVYERGVGGNPDEQFLDGYRGQVPVQELDLESLTLQVKKIISFYAIVRLAIAKNTPKRMLAFISIARLINRLLNEMADNGTLIVPPEDQATAV